MLEKKSFQEDQMGRWKGKRGVKKVICPLPARGRQVATFRSTRHEGSTTK